MLLFCDPFDQNVKLTLFACGHNNNRGHINKTKERGKTLRRKIKKYLFFSGPGFLSLPYLYFQVIQHQVHFKCGDAFFKQVLSVVIEG